MKIGEARQKYSAQIRAYGEAKANLERQREELEKKRTLKAISVADYEKQSATLELSHQAVSDKYDAYRSFMADLLELETGIHNAEVARQQGDAMAEYALDMCKLFEVARRIASGAHVPAEDERKLMEFSMELYQSAKSMAAMNELNDKEYDTLWPDEEKEEVPDAHEVAENTTMGLHAPEVVSVEDTIASAVVE